MGNDAIGKDDHRDRLTIRIEGMDALIHAIQNGSPETAARLKRIESKLDRLLVLTDRPAAGFIIDVVVSGGNVGSENPTGGNKVMSGKAGKMKLTFSVLDSGKVAFAARVVDSMGNPPNPPGLPSGTSTPAYSSSDSTVLSVATDPSDPTGLKGVGSPLALGTGVVVSISATLPDGTLITGSADPIDVIAGPGTSFVVDES